MHSLFSFYEEEKFIFDIQQYFAAYLPLRSADFLLGIEIGMQSAYAEESRTLIEKQPFDYVLGSLHLVEGVDLEEFAKACNLQLVYFKDRKMEYMTTE